MIERITLSYGSMYPTSSSLDLFKLAMISFPSPKYHSLNIHGHQSPTHTLSSSPCSCSKDLYLEIEHAHGDISQQTFNPLLLL